MSTPDPNPPVDPNAIPSVSECKGISDPNALALTPNDAGKVIAEAMGMNPCTQQAGFAYDAYGKVSIGSGTGEVGASGSGSISSTGCNAMAILGNQLAKAQASIACQISHVQQSQEAINQGSQTVNITVTDSKITGGINVNQTSFASTVTESVFQAQLAQTVDTKLSDMLDAFVNQDVSKVSGFGGDILAQGGRTAQTFEETSKLTAQSSGLQSALTKIRTEQLTSQTIQVYVLRSEVDGGININQSIQSTLVATAMVSATLTQFFKADIMKQAVLDFRQKVYTENRGLDDLVRAFTEPWAAIATAITLVIGVVVCVVVFKFGWPKMSMLADGKITPKGKWINIIVGVLLVIFLVMFIISVSLDETIEGALLATLLIGLFGFLGCGAYFTYILWQRYGHHGPLKKPDAAGRV